MRKAILEKRLNRLTAKRDALKARALASQDANEVNALYDQLEDLNDQIEETKEELAAIEAEEQSDETEHEDRSAAPAGAQRVNGNIVASFQQNPNPAQPQRTENYLESMEYRNAFRAYAMNGTPIVRAGEVISTADTGAAIPLTVMNEVINTVRKRYGNLYSKVRKLAVKGGVDFPIGALKATFKWINESTVSPRQKLGELGKVSFKYHTAEIRVSQTFLSNLLTLDSFERYIAEAIAIAYMQAMDIAIVRGSGDGQPLGIINDARVTNVVTMTAAQLSDWSQWRKRFFASLPLGYRAGEFIFPLATVDAYLETMADSNNNPIFRQATDLVVNDGDAQNPNGRFFGRDISLVEPDVLPDFDTASAGDVVGIYWQPDEYAINENFAFTMLRYFDQEENEWVDKALAVIDGKILNPNGFVLIKKA